ncbi:MAG: histidine kinase [Holophagaceae bacterium]|nr:histidine kinase [Holophagaceae bacterium]
MWALRTVVYRLAGWGAYDYGNLAFRAPMEGLKDLIGFAALAALFHVVEIRRRRSGGERRRALLESELRKARLQALSAQLDPHFLFNALNTLSSVMYEDLAKADRLLGDLGLMLRDGLEAGGATWTLDRELAAWTITSRSWKRASATGSRSPVPSSRASEASASPASPSSASWRMPSSTTRTPWDGVSR